MQPLMQRAWLQELLTAPSVLPNCRQHSRVIVPKLLGGSQRGLAVKARATFYGNHTRRGHGSFLLFNHFHHLTTTTLRTQARPTFVHPFSTMSSSEEENFDLDVSGSESESDDYAPSPKKKAPVKAKATKTAPKAKATTTKTSAAKMKVLSRKDDNASDEDDDDSDVQEGSSSGPAAHATEGKKKKSASETYQKVRKTRSLDLP